MKKRMMFVFAAALLSGGIAQAEEKKAQPAPAPTAKEKAAPKMEPNLKKILEEQTKKESAAWQESNKEYAEHCLAGIEKGKPVPPEKAVPSTDCYIKEVNENVKPVALNTHMVDDMTKEWKSLARKYSAKQISHKDWMKGMQDTQKKFSAARLQIIKGLIDDARKQATAKAK